MVEALGLPATDNLFDSPNLKASSSPVSSVQAWNTLLRRFSERLAQRQDSPLAQKRHVQMESESESEPVRASALELKVPEKISDGPATHRRANKNRRRRTRKREARRQHSAQPALPQVDTSPGFSSSAAVQSEELIGISSVEQTPSSLSRSEESSSSEPSSSEQPCSSCAPASGQPPNLDEQSVMAVADVAVDVSSSSGSRDVAVAAGADWVPYPPVQYALDMVYSRVDDPIVVGAFVRDLSRFGQAVEAALPYSKGGELLCMGMALGDAAEMRSMLEERSVFLPAGVIEHVEQCLWLGLKRGYWSADEADCMFDHLLADAFSRWMWRPR